VPLRWLPRPLVALRSLWGGMGTVPGSFLGGRRPHWRSAAPGEAIFARATFPRLYPLGYKSQKFGLEGWGVKIGNIYETVFFRLIIV
jgi:hypothetical protein